MWKKMILIIIALSLIFFFWMKMSVKKNGQIILLNGVSSSGKSAIIQELKKLKPDLYILKVDDWFPQALQNKATELGWVKESGTDPWSYLYEYLVAQTGQYYFSTEVREKLFDNTAEFYKQALEVASKGQDVIIDTVLEYKKEYAEFDSVFKGYDVKKILVYCPMDVLAKRVQQRNASGIQEENRTYFQSFEQFPAMFKVQTEAQESVVDTVQTQTMKETLDAAIAQLIEFHIPQPYLPKLDLFKKQFIQKFRLDLQDTIILVPTCAYDLILNSHITSPIQSAQRIVHFF